MFEFLENLRNRPDDHKRLVALGVSFGVTALIFMIWLSAFFVRIGQDSVVVTKNDIEVQKKKLAETLTPFESVKESAAHVGESFSRLRDLFDKANSLEYNAE